MVLNELSGHTVCLQWQFSGGRDDDDTSTCVCVCERERGEDLQTENRVWWHYIHWETELRGLKYINLIRTPPPPPPLGWGPLPYINSNYTHANYIFISPHYLSFPNSTSITFLMPQMPIHYVSCSIYFVSHSILISSVYSWIIFELLSVLLSLSTS